MFLGYLVGMPYPRDTRENQLSPSIMTLHIPIMLSTCFTSWEGYLATRENSFDLQFALTLHTLSHIQPIQ